MNQSERLQKSIQQNFIDLVELESPEFALGILESIKMAYNLVLWKKVNKSKTKEL